MRRRLSGIRMDRLFAPLFYSRRYPMTSQGLWRYTLGRVWSVRPFRSAEERFLRQAWESGARAFAQGRFLVVPQGVWGRARTEWLTQACRAFEYCAWEASQTDAPDDDED